MFIANYTRKSGKWLMTLAVLKACWLCGETTMHVSPDYEIRRPTKRALDSAPPYTYDELDLITNPRLNGALQDPPSQ